MAYKKIQSGQYLCSILFGYVVHVYLFSHFIKNFSECQMKIYLESNLYNVFNHIQVLKYMIQILIIKNYVKHKVLI